MSAPRPISIWRPRTVDGELVFERPAPGPWPDHHAARRVIPARSPRPRRLCFFGESAAAGYLLAPHLTPAMALQRRLGPGWDVVDLARTNERLDAMVATLDAAVAQLAPDVAVLFTGNNWPLLECTAWSPHTPDTEARRRVGEAIERGGLLGPAHCAAAELRERVEAAFAHVASLGVRVVLVVPGVNLADWFDRQPVPWLPGEGVSRWHRQRERAEALLARGGTRAAPVDVAADRADLPLGRSGSRPAEGAAASSTRPTERALARDHALAMLGLDDGRCPTGFELLGRATSDPAEARTALRAAVDTGRFATMGVLAAPRASASVQDLLRATAARHGFDLVDLPARWSSAPPGRDLFYDYCHLTPRGIDEAMTATASAVDSIADHGPLPLDPKAEAAACVGAAVHGVHRGARGEIVRYWLRRGLGLGARDALLALAHARLSRLPAELCDGAAEHGLSPQHGWTWPHLDAELLTAIADVVGPDALPKPARPRLEPWSFLDRPFADAVEADDVPRHAHWRCPWPTAELALWAPGAVDVEIVLRAPGPVSLVEGGAEIARWPGAEGWRRCRTRVDARPGLSRLTLHWPHPVVTGEAALALAIERLRQGEPADLHPVFGEVWSLSVSG